MKNPQHPINRALKMASKDIGVRLTKTWLAEKTGISISLICQYANANPSNGNPNPRVENAVVLAGFFESIGVHGFTAMDFMDPFGVARAAARERMESNAGAVDFSGLRAIR